MTMYQTFISASGSCSWPQAHTSTNKRPAKAWLNQGWRTS
jgi:hypothetical protein